jgi:hypothetical protein
MLFLLTWICKKILNLSQKKAVFIYEYAFYENNNKQGPVS